VSGQDQVNIAISVFDVAEGAVTIRKNAPLPLNSLYFYSTLSAINRMAGFWPGNFFLFVRIMNGQVLAKSRTGDKKPDAFILIFGPNHYAANRPAACDPGDIGPALPFFF
jgi:hypothetical protein